jgi:L-threonylcarbamoyladenylate synthase
MITKILPADDPEALKFARRILRQGGVVCFPTDTVYGIGAHAFDLNGVQELYNIKTRAETKAIPVLISQIDDITRVCIDVPDIYWKCALRFFPGGLTLVLKANPNLPADVTAGGDTVAVRIPDHPTPLSLISHLGAPIAATSANISGQPSPANVAQVLEQLGGRIPLILDGGPCRLGVPSTVVDLSVEPPVLLRQGSLSVESLKELLPNLVEKS